MFGDAQLKEKENEAYWLKYFATHFIPRICTADIKLYSSNLALHPQIIDEDSLRNVLELNSDFLKDFVGVKSSYHDKLLKVHLFHPFRLKHSFPHYISFLRIIYS